jgi:hypothetical protein
VNNSASAASGNSADVWPDALEALRVLIWVYREYGHEPSLKDLKRLYEQMTGEPYLHGSGIRELEEEVE